MRIACISSILGYPWGSPDRLWTGLARRCLGRGDVVFLGLSPLTANHPEVETLRTLGSELFLRQENSVYRGLRDQLIRRLPWHHDDYLEPRLSRFAPDVVVLTQGATYDSLAEHHLVDWLKSTRVPYVVLCHNNRPGPGPSADEAARLRRFFDGAVRTFFVSTENLRLAKDHLGGTLPRTSLIQNPLAAALSEAPPPSSPRAIPTLGMIGRLDIFHKGLDLLLAAAAKLHEPRPRIVLTGRCEDPAALRALIAQNGLTDCVEIRNALPATEVVGAHAELELFLLTSRYEGCASAMLEAMMCGRPVLATPVGGVSDWIDNEINGYVASDMSAEAIHATLVRALRQRDRWPEFGRRARSTFDTRRDPDPVGSLLHEVDLSVGVPQLP